MVFKSSANTGGSSSGVSSVDGITGAVTLVQGSNITISDNTPVAGSITISSSAGGGNVNTTGSPALGNIAIFSGATTITNGNLAGDVTTNGSLTVTLATVNSNIGSYGSSSSVPIITVNAKGLTTSISTVSYLGSALSGTTLASGILISSLTQVGTLATATWQASTITVPYGGTGLGTLTAHGVMLGEGTSNVGFATVGTSGRIFVDNGGSADPSFVAMVGDATITNNATLTLVTVNSNVGTYGSSNSAPVVTVNAKGLVTAVSTVSLGSGSVSVTGSPAVGNIAIFSSGTSITNTNLAGDVTTSGGSTVTLATVNSNVGIWGSSSSIPIVTVNAKGLTTGLSTASYLGSALSGDTLASGIVNSSLTKVGTLATATWQATSIALNYGGTGQDFSGSTGFVTIASSTASCGSITFGFAVNTSSITADGTYALVVYSPCACTITAVKQIASNSGGTVTANFKINTTSITGLSAISVTSTAQDVSASGANTVAAGDAINLTTTSSTSLTNLQFLILATRTA